MSTINAEIESIIINSDKINNNKDYVHRREYMKWEPRNYGSDVTKCKNCAGNPNVKGMGICHLGCGVGNNK